MRIIVLVTLVLAACGSPQAPATETKAELSPPSVPAPAAIVWAEMDQDQKEEHMKKVVLPAAKRIFAKSPEPPEKVNCAYCHGSGAEVGDFEMPNPDLAKISFANDMEKHKDDKEMVEFMMKVVEPEIAKTLGLEPYDPETSKGFGCFACHEKDTD